MYTHRKDGEWLGYLDDKVVTLLRLLLAYGTGRTALC